MKNKPSVIVDPHFRTMDEIFLPNDLMRLHNIADVIHGQDTPMPQDQFLAALPDAEVIVCADWRYGDVLEQANNLRAILTVSGAFPLELDYEYCYQNKIRVMSAAPAFGRQVAEMCLGLALASARDIAKGDREMRQGDEPYLHHANMDTFMLYGKTVGIIGYGNIARELHALLKPFGVHVMAYDPWLGERYLTQQGTEPATLEALLDRSKVIFVLAAPTKENTAMLSREKLERLHPGDVLVLGSRAHVIDFDAMTEMVLAGRFKVATDVFPTEPLQSDHPIRNAEEAVLSAHKAGSLSEGLQEIGEMVVDDLEMIVRGLPPRRLQNAEPELSMRYTTNKAKS